MKRNVDVVIDYFNKIKHDFPNIKNEDLYDNGSMYYMNGNDGTAFDWACNDRLCEFFIFGKNEMGFIKVFVNKNDTIQAYVYEDCGMHPTKKYDVEYLPNNFAKHLKDSMLRAADYKAKYDMPLRNLFKL